MSDTQKPDNSDKEELLQALQEEKDALDPSFVQSIKLLEKEIEQVKSGIDTTPKPPPDFPVRLTELHHGNPQKFVERIYVPIKEYPKFNFIGKLLGPHGNTLKQLQADTGCKIAILGRGSMRDKNEEEEKRNSDDPKYGHLKKQLHVAIEVFTTASDAHRRISHATNELAKFLSPELAEEIPAVKHVATMGVPLARGRPRGMAQPVMRGRGAPIGASTRGIPRGAARGVGARGSSRGASRGIPSSGTRGSVRGTFGGSATRATSRGGVSRGARGASAAPTPTMAPQATAAVYEEEYYQTTAQPEYEENTSYDQTAYDSYTSTQTTATAETEYYDSYGTTQPAQQHSFEENGTAGFGEAVTYTTDTYAKDSFTSPGFGKAPQARKEDFRTHPYGRGAAAQRRF